MTTIPRVSIIVPAFNEAANILSLLRALAAQQLPPSEFEVIVVDNGSADTTLSLARGFASPFSLQVVQKIGGTIGQVRNYGASLARADILAFLDADNFPGPDWLVNALNLQCDNHVWGQDYLPQPDASWVGKTWFDFQAGLRDGPVNFIPSGNLFVYRAAFERFGGFSAFETSEDVELCQRLSRGGMHIVAHPALAVVTAGTPGSLHAFYLQHRWHGNHVLRVFLHQLPKLSNLSIVLVTVYTFITFWAWIVALIVAAISRQGMWAALFFVLLVLPAAALALVKAMRKGRFSAILKLFVLYQTYLLARAAALIRVPVRNHR